jgi:hypothetical protein
MTWFTAALLAGYIGICEYRAPTPWVACEGRWNWALGVLVPSPLQGAGRLIAGQLRRRREPDIKPDNDQQP